jgi:nicotinamide-nucleotide amidase
MSTLRIELLNTGSELLLGSVRDAHLAWFGRQLFPLGLRINRQTTVPDGAPIRDAIVESFSRTDVLIVTGGLGPTTDDITRELVAELLGRKLTLHSETLERIHERCRKRGFSFQSRMERQAMAPEGGMVFPNDNGTAPGLYLPPVESVSSVTPHIFLLPGPPREMQPMAQLHVLPLLGKLVGEEGRFECRVYKVVGMGESMVESMVGLQLSKRGDIEVGYCALPNEVDFRLIAPREVLEEVEPMVLAAVGDNLIRGNESSLDSMEEVVISLLSSRHETVATAESCTGGHLANRLTNVPGASTVFVEGFVTYSNSSKSERLGVLPEILQTHGAVSEPVVRALAEGVLQKSGATYALATTGIAGPGGGTTEKPVGTVWIAMAQEGRDTESWKEMIPTDRVTFKHVVTQSALDRLRRRLKDSP